MFIFALISEIPFDLAINNTVLEFKSNNVFFTLLLGLLAITVLDWLKSVDKIEKASSAVKWFFCHTDQVYSNGISSACYDDYCRVCALL